MDLLQAPDRDAVLPALGWLPGVALLCMIPACSSSDGGGTEPDLADPVPDEITLAPGTLAFSALGETEELRRGDRPRG